MKIIKLTNGQEAKVDDEDYERLSQFKWSTAGKGYASNVSHGQHLFMHHAVMGESTEQVIHHKDGDKLNNQKSNLEFITYSSHNQHHGKNTELRYRGVYINKGRLKFFSHIGKDGKVYYIGSFDTPEEAARAYDKKAIELYGEHARLNFPK